MTDVNLSDFVHQTYAEMKQAQPPISELPLIVIGNETGDMDSTVCAISYAFFLSEIRMKTVWPVINVKRSEFASRTNVHWHLCTRIGPNFNEYLIFIDDIESLGRFDAILVDHNKALHPFINPIGIIDHHDDAEPGNYEPFVVEKVGSCATLVSDLIFYGERFRITPSFAHFLLAPILNDTIGLSVRTGRCAEKDFKMASALIQIIKGPQDPSVHLATMKGACNSILAAIQEVALLTNSLTVEQILKRDMKMTTTQGGYKIAISMLPIGYDVKEFLCLELISVLLVDFVKSMNIDCLIIMSLQHTGFGSQAQLLREIAVASQNSPLQRKMSKYLETSSLDLKLELYSELVMNPDSMIFINHYFQHSVDKSRKDILPLVRSFVE